MMASKKTQKIMVIFSITCLLSFTFSCKKYENDEDFMHFTRVKKRICQTWQLYSWQDPNGVEKFDSSSPNEFNYTVTFKEFETKEQKRQNKEWEGFFNSSFIPNPSMNWGFSDKKNTLKSASGYESKIVKLTDKELWLADGKDPVNFLNFKTIKYRKL